MRFALSFRFGRGSRDLLDMEKVVNAFSSRGLMDAISDAEIVILDAYDAQASARQCG